MRRPAWQTARGRTPTPRQAIFAGVSRPDGLSWELCGKASCFTASSPS